MRSRVVIASLVVLSLLAGGVAASSWALADPRPSFYGVRLGMTADAVRARVDERGPGTWTASSSSGEWILEHARDGEHARFELHDGQLMAVRVDAIATRALEGAPYEVTAGSVLHREPLGERIRWTLVSRACPTHRDEAEALVRAAADASP